MLRRTNYNLANYQQQGAEQFNFLVKNHFMHQSAKGAGANAVHPSLDTILCFGRTWLRMIDVYFPGWLDKQREEVSIQDIKAWRTTAYQVPVVAPVVV